MATKYKEYFQKMLDLEHEAFDSFREVHDEYMLDPQKMQDKFNEEGKKIQYIIRKYEDMLCNRSEGSGYGSYSGKLAEKFQNEIRKHFPKIDSIGIRIIPAYAPVQEEDGFEIKKIELS